MSNSISTRLPKGNWRRYLLIGLVFCIFAAVDQQVSLGQSRDRFRDQRLKMVKEYIEREGVKNPRVLSSMRQVPRHEFVRPSVRMQAYFDAALSIGFKQTISPPFVVAYMTESIDPQPTDKVLEIGTGSGYQAAVLSALAKDVYSIEIVEPLGKAAAARLKRLGYDNVHTKIGDGYQGWLEHAPFDKIIVTCSPENVPRPLIDQLKEGGRMIIPLGERYQQVFYLFEKRDGELVKTQLIPTLFVPMTGVSEEKRKIKPDPENPAIINGGFETDGNNDGLPDNWHYQRQSSLESEDAPQGKQYLCFQNETLGRLSQALQGMPLDGRKIRALKIDLSVSYDKLVAGTKSYEHPSLMIHFFDSRRKPIGERVIGPWKGSSKWQRVSSRLIVPTNAREAIVRIGLNGGTGRLCVDEIALTPQKR